MALDFPSTPSNGDIYQQYVYNATDGRWELSTPSTDRTPVAGVVSGTSGSPTITTDGADTIYSFTVDGTITVESAGTFDLLLVGGGGAGGIGGAGGGAGGCLYIEGAYLPAGTHTVTVGAGGTGYTSPQNSVAITGNNGETSWIGGLYFAPGGGGGAARGFRYNSTSQWSQSGQNGGSGSGAASGLSLLTNDPGVGVSGLGNDGGVGWIGGYGGGGGGGAGSAGVDAVSGTGGNGGLGRTISITGSAVTYAGGGGGGRTLVGGTDGLGGSGGGGDAHLTNGLNGTDGLGGGGGGTYDATATCSGGNGGNGIVIVRTR